MFKDYYKILGISFSSSDEEIKKAYRKMSLKWHPDKNIGIDVTKEMQDVNEAYAILKDKDKKLRYDNEYLRFTSDFIQRQSKKAVKSNENYNSTQKWSYDYDVKDENLQEDIKSAREYAKEIVEEFMQNIRETSKVAVKGAAKNAFYYAIGWIFAGIILAIIGTLIRTCN